MWALRKVSTGPYWVSLSSQTRYRVFFHLLTRVVHSIIRQTFFRRSRKALRPDRSVPRRCGGQGWWKGGYGECARGFPQAPVKKWIRRVALRAPQGAKGLDLWRYISLFEGFLQEIRSFLELLCRLFVSLSGLSAMRRFSCTCLFLEETEGYNKDVEYKSSLNKSQYSNCPARVNVHTSQYSNSA